MDKLVNLFIRNHYREIEECINKYFMGESAEDVISSDEFPDNYIKRKVMFNRSNSRPRWDAIEYLYISLNIDKMNLDRLSMKLGRSCSSVSSKIENLKKDGYFGKENIFDGSAFGRDKKKWDEDEKNYLKENYGDVPIEDIASELRRSVKSVRSKVHRMGLNHTVSRDGRRYSEEEEKVIINNYGKISIRKISQKFPERSYNGLRQKIYRMKCENKL